MGASAFENGLDAMQAQDYKGAVRDFEEFFKEIDEHDDQYNRVESYLGLARVLTDDDSGLLMCRDAASDEAVYGDVFLNMACAEWHSNQRKRAIDAINKGLEIDSGHQQLNKVSAMLDGRKRNIIHFLDRDHFLNKFLGRFLRKKSPEITVHTLLY